MLPLANTGEDIERGCAPTVVTVLHRRGAGPSCSQQQTVGQLRVFELRAQGWLVSSVCMSVYKTCVPQYALLLAYIA